MIDLEDGTLKLFLCSVDEHGSIGGKETAKLLMERYELTRQEAAGYLEMC